MVPCRARRPSRPLRGSTPLLLLAMAVAMCALLPAARAQGEEHQDAGQRKGMCLDGSNPSRQPTPCLLHLPSAAAELVGLRVAPRCPPCTGGMSACVSYASHNIVSHKSLPGASDVLKPEPEDVVTSVGKTRGPGSPLPVGHGVAPCCLDAQCTQRI